MPRTANSTDTILDKRTSRKLREGAYGNYADIAEYIADHPEQEMVQMLYSNVARAVERSKKLTIEQKNDFRSQLTLYRALAKSNNVPLWYVLYLFLVAGLPSAIEQLEPYFMAQLQKRKTSIISTELLLDLYIGSKEKLQAALKEAAREIGLIEADDEESTKSFKVG